jgi:hypothetical protein
MAQTFPFKLTKANRKAPFNPFIKEGNPQRGDPDDPAAYTRNPGVHFYRPWLASNDKFNGPAFIWPLGLEGFSLSIEPQLGIHRFIGDNAVVVDVTHLGEERFTMSGSFPGDSGPDNLRALRQIVYLATPKLGKVLYVPHILPYAQRVTVARASFTREQDDRGQDLSYEIEFIRTGILDIGKYGGEPKIVDARAPGTGGPQKGSRSIQSDAKHNTLRKIAEWKLGSSKKWSVLYDKNEEWFHKRGVAASKVPDYHLPVGTKVFY